MDEIVVISVSCAGGAIAILCLFLAAWWWRRPDRSRTKDGHESRKSALSLGGNLVYEYSTPIEEKYRLVTQQRLGSGSSAEVVVGEHLITKRKYAIKIVELTKKEVTWRYEREKNFLKDIDHTNVVRLYEVCSRPTALYFVMELCTGGHLGQVLRSTQHGRLSEDRTRTYIQQLSRAIAHCHYHGIAHRDVKLQNILLESNNHADAQIKLVDFGNGARFRGHLPMRKIVGTTYTAAPEVFRENYDERCDVWSLGIVTYILLSGRRPFEKMKLAPENEHLLRLPANSRLPAESRNGTVVTSILMGRYDFNFPEWDKISVEAMEFVRYCLVLDYSKRNTASEMLEHPWLTYADEEFPSIGAHGLSRISQGSALALKKTLKREATSGSQLASMRHTSMLAVAFNLTTTKTQQLRKLFQEMDQDGSGSIDRDEFLTAVQTVNPEMSTEHAYELFDRLDQDWNRCISFIEFLAAMVDPDDVDMQDMNQAFRLLDKDQKGYITREDLMRVLSTSTAEEIILSSDMTIEAKQRGRVQGAVSSEAIGGSQRSPAELLSSSPVRLARTISETGKLLLGSNKTPTGSATGNKHFFPEEPTTSTPHFGDSSKHPSNKRSSKENYSDTITDGAKRGSISPSATGPLTTSLESKEDQRAKAAVDRAHKLQERIQEIMEKADVNKDGVVSYTEFLFAMADGTMLERSPAPIGRIRSRDEGLHKVIGGGAKLGGSNSSRDLRTFSTTDDINSTSAAYSELINAPPLVKAAHSQPNVMANIKRTMSSLSNGLAGRRMTDGAVAAPVLDQRRLSDSMLFGRSPRSKDLSPPDGGSWSGSGDNAFLSGDLKGIGRGGSNSRPLVRNMSAHLNGTTLDAIEEKSQPSLFKWITDKFTSGTGKQSAGVSGTQLENQHLPPKFPVAPTSTHPSASAGSNYRHHGLTGLECSSADDDYSSRSGADSSRVPTFFQQSPSAITRKNGNDGSSNSGKMNLSNDSMSSDKIAHPHCKSSSSSKRYTVASSSGNDVRRNSAISLVRNMISFGSNRNSKVAAEEGVAAGAYPDDEDAIFSEEDMVMNDTDEGLLNGGAADYSSVLPDEIVLSGNLSRNQRREGADGIALDISSSGPAVSGENSVASFEEEDDIEAQRTGGRTSTTVLAVNARSNSYDSNDSRNDSYPSDADIHDLLNEEVFTLSSTAVR